MIFFIMSTMFITEAEIIKKSKPIQALLNNPPKVQPHLTVLFNWIIQLGFALVGLIANLTKPIMDKQGDFTKSAQLASVYAIPPPSAAATGTSSNQHGSPASSKRCNWCHAHGHTVEDCKTTNPSAMRRWVVRNNCITKEARWPLAPPISNIPPSFYMPTPYPSPLLSTQPVVEVATSGNRFVLDITEWCYGKELTSLGFEPRTFPIWGDALTTELSGLR